MAEKTTNQSVRAHIEELVAAEHGLYEKGDLDDGDRSQLNHLKLELDQCWDLLRQRRALQSAGQDPDRARVRPIDVVESYEG